MKRLIPCLLMLSAIVAAADEPTHRLREVVATAHRPMTEIGLQKSTVDSLALKENISLSIADVLTFNSSVFVKSYGRATLSTVSFRGTSPSHTRVTWNGMEISSPMLGMTDFSTIPAYFIDSATLLHGSSSVSETGGGLGGLIKLSTEPIAYSNGFGGRYTQGIGSFSTFDESLRLDYSSGAWQSSTRAVVSTSANDFTFTNHDKKLNIYDSGHNIVSQYHPREKNRSGEFADVNLLQELHYLPSTRRRLSLCAWYTRSNRHIPMLTTDYADATDGYLNRQLDRTLRAVASATAIGNRWRYTARLGYVNSGLNYDFRRMESVMARSRSRVNSGFAEADAAFTPHSHLSLNGSAKVTFTDVRSHDITDGYSRHRLESSVALSARWQATERLGVAATIRQETSGHRVPAPIPALFADMRIWDPINLIIKASASLNHRIPTLNDLYFKPGGNPDLKDERGFSYDCGLEASRGPLSLSLTGFDSYITDWIIWLPTPRGYFSPRNLKTVHAYGVEAKASVTLVLGRDWKVDANGSFSWTPSINKGEKLSEADRSQGRQLPYVPRRSASATVRVEWRRWSLLYKWCHYSRRFTMSSNDATLTGQLPPYFMSNASLERKFRLSRRLELMAKLAVNNLLNEDYLSVLSRPMPGINFEAFISLTF